MTLIEVLIAVSILAFGIVGVLRAYAVAVATLEAGQISIDGVNVLKATLGDIRVMLEEEKNPLEQDSGTSEEFQWAWDIKPSDIEELNELTIQVAHNVDPRMFSLKTYVVAPKDAQEE